MNITKRLPCMRAHGDSTASCMLVDNHPVTRSHKHEGEK